MDDNSLPKIVTQVKYGIWPFTISYLCEDRRPDLTIEQAGEILKYKYKHRIVLKILFFELVWSIHSLYIGGFYINGKEQLPS